MFYGRFVSAMLFAAGLLASSNMANGHVIRRDQSDREMQDFCQWTRDLRAHAMLRRPLRAIGEELNDSMRQEDRDLAHFITQPYTFSRERTLENLASSLNQTLHDLACMKEALHQCHMRNDRLSVLLHVFRQLALEASNAHSQDSGNFQAIPMPSCQSGSGQCALWKAHPELSVVFGHHTVKAALRLATAMEEECSRVDDSLN